jgi:hypothetical protein
VRHLRFLFLLALFLVFVPRLTAQKAASPNVNVISGPVGYALPPPKPSDWFELQLWSCNPLDCFDTEVEYDGSVTTSIIGVCYNNATPSAAISAYAVNCSSPLLLDTYASTRWTTKKFFLVTYAMEGVYVEADIYDDFGNLTDFGYLQTWCDGTSSSVQEPPLPC